MSRALLANAKHFRFPCNCFQLRQASDKCPPIDPPKKECGYQLPKPKMKLPCDTKAASKGRTDAELDACLVRQIANPLHSCTTPSIAAFPCEQQKKPKNRGKKEVIEYPSAWEKVECCNSVSCAVNPIRHDILYLKPEPKCNRRTWCEWSALCIEDQVKCEPPKFIVDPPEYRPTTPYVKEIIKEPCGINPCEPAECRPRGQTNKAATANQPPVKLDPCPKIRLPGCRPGSTKTKCVPPVAPKCCQKRCTQYPSFSECCRTNPDLLHPKECDCLNTPSQCEVFARLRRMAVI